ncbi:hypothetical protein GCM10027195_23910 [Comamonas sediminis]
MCSSAVAVAAVLLSVGAFAVLLCALARLGAPALKPSAMARQASAIGEGWGRPAWRAGGNVGMWFLWAGLGKCRSLIS